MGPLLLRVTVGLSLLVQGEACLAGENPGIWAWAWAVGLLDLVTGASLLIGFLPPVAGSLAELLSLGYAFSWLPSSTPDVLGGTPATIFLIVMAVLLLGPGAYSLDPRWFGRREIVIPPPSERPP